MDAEKEKIDELKSKYEESDTDDEITVTQPVTDEVSDSETVIEKSKMLISSLIEKVKGIFAKISGNSAEEIKSEIEDVEAEPAFEKDIEAEEADFEPEENAVAKADDETPEIETVSEENTEAVETETAEIEPEINTEAEKEQVDHKKLTDIFSKSTIAVIAVAVVLVALVGFLLGWVVPVLWK